jgi:hypothetical protein
MNIKYYRVSGMRVTFDLDNIKEHKAEGKAKLLKIAFPLSKVMYRMSSSGKGCHITLYDDFNEINELYMYNIRRLFGDHDLRIKYDLSRGKRDNPMLPLQVLFDFKVVDGETMRATKWKEII